MMTLSENSRDSEQNLRWIAWEKENRRTGRNPREADGVCFHRNGRNFTGFRFLYALLRIRAGGSKQKPANLFNF